MLVQICTSINAPYEATLTLGSMHSNNSYKVAIAIAPAQAKALHEQCGALCQGRQDIPVSDIWTGTTYQINAFI